MKLECLCFSILAATILFFVGLLGYVGYNYFHTLKLKEGVVISKDHSDEFYQTTIMTMSDGKTTTMYPVTTYYPESWSVTIEGDAPDGEHLTRNISVNQSQWNGIQMRQKLNVE